MVVCGDLSPALAALLLKPKGAKKDLIARGLDLALGWFFRLFNKGFGAENFMITEKNTSVRKIPKNVTPI